MEDIIELRYPKLTLREWNNKVEKSFPKMTKEPGYFINHKTLSLKVLETFGRAQATILNHYQKTGRLDFVAFDVETTGLNPAIDFELGEAGITDIAGVIIENGYYKGNKVHPTGLQETGENTYEFDTLVNPGVLIPKEVSEITNITNDMVIEAPNQLEVAKAFKKFSKGKILVAHNGGDLNNSRGYDIPNVLGPVYKRFFNQNVDRMLESAIDTLPLFRALVGGIPHTNEDFGKYAGYKLVGAHRAMPDTRINALVFTKLLPLILQLDLNELADYIEEKFSGRDYFLRKIMPYADHRHTGCEVEGLQLKLSIDKGFKAINPKTKRLRIQYITLHYDVSLGEFIYSDQTLDDGRVIPKRRLEEELPPHHLRRLIQMFSKKKGFENAIQGYLFTNF